MINPAVPQIKSRGHQWHY